MQQFTIQLLKYRSDAIDNWFPDNISLNNALCIPVELWATFQSEYSKKIHLTLWYHIISIP